MPDRVEIIPARSGISCRKDYCYKDITILKFKKAFVKNQLSHLDFSIKEDSDSEPTGIFTEYDIGTYFDPDVKNDRDCLLQAKGIPYAGTPNERKRTLLPDSILALQESYFKLNEDSSLTKTTSKAIIIANHSMYSVWPEYPIQLAIDTELININITKRSEETISEISAVL